MNSVQNICAQVVHNGVLAAVPHATIADASISWQMGSAHIHIDTILLDDAGTCLIRMVATPQNKMFHGIRSRIDHLNCMATTAALVEDGADGTISLQSSVRVSADSIDMARTAIATIIQTALLSPMWLSAAAQSLLTDIAGGSGPIASMVARALHVAISIPAMNQESKWTHDELARAADVLGATPNVGSTGAMHIDASIPLSGRDPARLLIETGKRHKHFGNGLAVELRMPAWATGAGATATTINTDEAINGRSYPLLGAWTDRDGTLVFHSFYANLFHRPGLLDEIVRWSILRANHAL